MKAGGEFITIDQVLHPDYVAVDEMARILGYKRQTVHNLMSKGDLVVPSVGKIAGLPRIYERVVVERIAAERRAAKKPGAIKLVF